MSRCFLCRTFLSLPLVTALAVLAGGCGGGDKKDVEAPSSKEPKSGSAGSAKAPTKGELLPVDAPATASLKGKVTFEGEVPAPRDLKPDMEKKKEPHCLSNDPRNHTTDPLWMISPNKEVQNVVVWLRAPKGKFFNIPDDQKNRTKEVTIDQPFCLFEPHVVAVFPSYFDPKTKKQTPSGEKFHVINSAPINHNTKWSGDGLINAGGNQILATKQDLSIPAKPSQSNRAGGEDLINIVCDIHPWMNAKAWVFDHPYFAVTKSDGTYEIKNAPAGVPLEVAYWHESFGDKDKPRVEENVTLKAGAATEKDFVIKK